ncbi:hypothetical protein [Methylobacterium marchantiae]|uniref:Peptidase M48 domain-containing protein n=1 Tax=Methylobacterium marchantiae TaxID=600331 RepID=A0ABW3WWM6_9HYPH|nr:hypothetical protein AIGOOFII_3148 [Methylobacterium marchantiae]
MSEFDLNLITDEAVRIEYTHILARAERIGQALHRAYGAGRLTIKTKYILDDSFNADADEQEGRYLISLSAAIPLFNLILFGRLFSDPDIMPELDASGTLASDYELPAVIDPSNFSKRSNWKIELNPIRAFAAGTLADLCSTFIVCHEMGHVLSGHVEGMRVYEGQSSVSEFVRQLEIPKIDFDRRQAWELDADIIASSLLMEFIGDLWRSTESNPRSKMVFGAGHEGLENIISTGIVSLFAFFCYLNGTRDKLELESTHPHPLVRAYYIRDMIVNLARTRWDVDPISIARLIDKRLDEFLRVLQKNSLFDAREFTSRRARAIEKDVARIKELQVRHRSSCAKWCWISWHGDK